MTEILIVALAIFGYSLVSERLANSPITSPMVFTAVGLAVGSAGFGWFDLEIGNESTSILVEATLVLVLFTDAIRIDLRVLRREAVLPGRLLAIGLPLSILAGTLAGVAILDGFTVLHAALLAAVLAPTDAALGQAVVSDPRLPVRVRQTLNVESGLNDGIAVPVVTVLLSIAVADQGSDAGDWVGLAARQIGFGLLAGVGVGVIGGWLLDQRSAAGAIEGVYRQLATVAIAAGAFGLAGLLDGNGFIAAFTAGLAFGRVARSHCDGIQDFTEDEGELLAAITFIVFGAVLAGTVIDELDWRIALYAIASLTIVRIVPSVIALIGSGTLFETRLFFGWFGPRGLATILFALVVIEELESEAGEMIFTVATWTVLFSIVAHGVSARPWAGRLARRIENEVEPMAEMEPATAFPTRRS